MHVHSTRRLLRFVAGLEYPQELLKPVGSPGKDTQGRWCIRKT